tara:strand:+ start:5570 stop:5821 length:252 start_codon:yes stop_codon:yes gene_type:complete
MVFVNMRRMICRMGIRVQRKIRRTGIFSSRSTREDIRMKEKDPNMGIIQTVLDTTSRDHMRGRLVEALRTLIVTGCAISLIFA